MNRMFTGAVTLAGSLALAGGAIVATAMPAAATSHPAPDNLAYATYAPTGDINVSGPNGVAEAPPATTTVDPNDSIAGVVRTGTTTDTAGTTTAYSKVPNASTNTFTWFSGSFTYTLKLAAALVSTNCNSDSLTAHANINSGTLTETSQFLSTTPVTTTVFNLSQHPVANQTYNFHGATVVVNDQTLVNSTLETQGVNLTVPDSDADSAPQTLTIATTLCTATGADAIFNGDFEASPPLAGWTPSGDVSIVTPGQDGAGNAAQIGATVPTAETSSISQTFLADGFFLDFFYKQTCTSGGTDGVTVTLLDNTTGVPTTLVGPARCTTDASWKFAFGFITPGDNYTFTLTNTDDGDAEVSNTLLDDVAVF